MSYCIVRPGGMERPKDDYKESHNLVIKPRDTIFGGQVGSCSTAQYCLCGTCRSYMHDLLHSIVEQSITSSLPF